MSDPLVSVVIPTRNRADLLAEAVAGAGSQTVEDIEIIVVDDASQDHTPKLLAELAAADRRIRVERNEARRGGPAARNRGVLQARGAVLALLDDDDTWEPHKLERQLAALDHDPGLVAVSCDHRVVAPGHGSLDHRGPREVTARDLLWENFLGSASFCAWRPALAPGVRFDESLPSMQDWDLWLKLAQHGPVHVVPEVLCTYRAGPHPRITTARSARRAGRRVLLERLRSRMTRDCIGYHRVRVALEGRGPVSGALAAAPTLATHPRVARVVAGASRAGRAGWRQGDPARGLRRLHELVHQSGDQDDPGANRPPEP